jgi:hypothetical protein
MASDFPRSPTFLKGALVAYASQFLGPIPNIIVFQYNPTQLTRRLANRTPSSTSQQASTARADAYRVQGPPVETITLAMELDAADQLAEPGTHPHTVAFGLNPALAALELLLYPSTTQVLLNQALTRAGTANIAEADIPMVLLVWGPSRVLPVRLTSFSITEQAFDQKLNPIQAKVDLGMKVMTYMELETASLARTAYTVSQVQKEAMARLNLINSVEQIVGMMPF